MDQAVSVCLPKKENQNNSLLFHLARALLTVEQHAGQMTMEQKIAAFDDWYAKSLNLGFLRAGQTRDQYLGEFLESVRNAQYPLGMNPDVIRAKELAESLPYPKEANFFKSKAAQLLVAICYHLHQISVAAGREWYLACRTAGELIGESHESAAGYLRSMIALGILNATNVDKGRQKATRYEYKNP